MLPLVLCQACQPKLRAKWFYQNQEGPKAKSFCMSNMHVKLLTNPNDPNIKKLNHISNFIPILLIFRPSSLYLHGLMIPLTSWRIDTGFFLLGSTWILFRNSCEKQGEFIGQNNSQIHSIDYNFFLNCIFVSMFWEFILWTTSRILKVKLRIVGKALPPT